jgi:hypothetical protein
MYAMADYQPLAMPITIPIALALVANYASEAYQAGNHYQPKMGRQAEEAWVVNFPRNFVDISPIPFSFSTNFFWLYSNWVREISSEFAVCCPETLLPYHKCDNVSCETNIYPSKRSPPSSPYTQHNPYWNSPNGLPISSTPPFCFFYSLPSNTCIPS